jgi:cold shock CspA family protein
MAGAAPLGLAAAYATRSGRVAAFDDHVGAGTVEDDLTGEVWPFHCTRIGDGSRTIAEGTWVTFTVTPGPVGLEAEGLRRRG